MPRKKKPKADAQAVELPAAEPITLAVALEKSPIAEVIASHEAEAQPDPQSEAVDAFQRQREREQAVTETSHVQRLNRIPVGPTGKLSHAEKVLAERPAYRPAPEEYFRVASHEREGIRVFKDTVVKGGHKIGISGIQFAENRQPTSAEKDYLEERGFRYKIEENLWKREGVPGEPLGDNVIDATRVASDLARERQGRAR